MKKNYLTPEAEMFIVAVEGNLLATGTSLSGSSGENMGGTTTYDDDWIDV